MSERFCPTCGAEVEDTGGYCLLGHSLRLNPPAESLASLRAEVDRAFAEADLRVAMARHPAAGSKTVEEPWETPLPAVAVFSDDPDEVTMPVVFGDLDIPPSPPREIPTALVSSHNPVLEDAHADETRGPWKAIENETPLSPSDPITAFSPPPRMDWGPDRPRFFRRGRAGRSRSDAQP